MDHKRVWIKKEERREVKRYPSSVKKEELQEDTDEEYDALEMKWSSIREKEDSKLRFSMDDTRHKQKVVDDDGNGDESSPPSQTSGHVRISRTGEPSPRSNRPWVPRTQDAGIQQRQEKRQLFVGNLTWWTTDQDIADAILGIGVTDLIGVKFFENRINGQSKGFCVVTLGSDESMKMCFERLQEKQLHGQSPLVSFPTKPALNQFEAQSKRGTESRPSYGAKYAARNKTLPPQGMNRMRPPPGMPPPSSGQQMLGEPQAPWHPQVPPPPPGHPLPSFQYSWSESRTSVPPPPYGAPVRGPPAPRVNPTFFQPGAGPPPQGLPPTHQPPPSLQWTASRSTELHPQGPPPPISEVEFRELMGQNRSISSSAIARAVSDAAAGEYKTAVDTLITAISLIKQSKAANDACCKVLITTLQDTLNGIETKGYEYARRERSQSRDRERLLRSRRERSHSRDRAYRERSRDRDREREREHYRCYADACPQERSRSRERERGHDDRYYEDRYRERERERDRDRTRHEAERDRERRDDRESSHRITHH